MLYDASGSTVSTINGEIATVRSYLTLQSFTFHKMHEKIGTDTQEKNTKVHLHAPYRSKLCFDVASTYHRLI